MARLLSDLKLGAEARLGSWKFEVSDDHEQAAYKSHTVFPGDGVDDFDSLLAWMDRHITCEVYLLGVNSGRDLVHREDVARMRELYVAFYGEVDRVNEYPPLSEIEPDYHG
jgi:hypothetical protein